MKKKDLLGFRFTSVLFCQIYSRCRADVGHMVFPRSFLRNIDAGIFYVLRVVRKTFSWST